MPKPSLYYQTYTWRDEAVQIFPQDFNAKTNVIALLEFELTYSDVAVQYHTRTLPH